MTFARKRPVLACPRGDERIQSGGRFPHHVGAIGVGFCFLQCDSILGNFARSLHLSCVSPLCVCLVLPTPPILILLGCHAAGCRGIIVSWAAWPLRALAERACKLGRAGWGEGWRDVVWFGFQEAPPWLLINQASRELGGVVIKLSNPYKYDAAARYLDARNRTGR